jgi:hypothetical protein
VVEEFQLSHNDGSPLSFIRFLPDEPLTPVRHFHSRYDSKVIIWDRVGNTREEHEYDEDIHSAARPAFIVEGDWIVSAITRRQLLWLPETRRPAYCGSYAVRGHMVAIGSAAGEISLMDMSAINGLQLA